MSMRVEDNNYDFNHNLRGLALIVNIDPDDRLGSEHDVRMMKEAMENHGFNTSVKDGCFNDQDVMALLIEAANWEGHKRSDCFVCIFMSHGNEIICTTEDGNKSRMDVVRCSDKKVMGYSENKDINEKENIIRYETILDCFNEKNCQGLKGKPKMFFFQMCRGNEIKDQGSEVKVETKAGQSNQTALNDGAEGGSEKKDISGELTFEAVPENFDYDRETSNVYHVPISRDYLAMYATTPGQIAVRDPQSGSWMIKELYQVLMSDSACETSLLTLLTRVLNKMALSKEYDKDPDDPKMKKLKGLKALPVIETMLRKEVVFSRK